MSWQLLRGDARKVSDLLAPASVDLIVTSPPYFALRSYRDDGEHYAGQLGSEATPGEFVDALIECTRDWLKVLRPGGSIFVNLGDKRANAAPSGSAGYLNAKEWVGAKWEHQVDTMPPIRTDTFGIRAKSLMGLPWRYALRCVDELGLILRADIIWHKPNGLPESVTDRVRQSHEYWFHLTREARYFAAVDEVREAHAEATIRDHRFTTATGTGRERYSTDGMSGAPSGMCGANPLGKLPGSVWTIPSEPLTVPDHLGVDHFAAFPSEWPRRLILGWSPTGWCQGCGEARRAVVARSLESNHAPMPGTRPARIDVGEHNERGWNGAGYAHGSTAATILGYACACPDTAAPTQPAVILDPFVGTGTTVAVAHHLGRHGIGIDLSRDYLRLAEWRCEHDTALRDKVLARSDLPRAPVIDGQLALDFL